MAKPLAELARQGPVSTPAVTVDPIPAASPALGAAGYVHPATLAPSPTDQYFLGWDNTTVRQKWLGAFSSYTPALTASTVNPNLGTSPTQTGNYIQIGKLVMGNAVIVFGTGGGVAAGTGTYRIGLPVTATSGAPQIGSGNILDNSAALVRLVVCELGSTTYLTMRYDNAGLGVVTAALPWVWATADQLSVTFCYQAA